MAFLSSWHTAAGGVEVDFDWTIFGQVALFVVLLLALKPLLFDPMLKLFEERERRIEGARKKAREIDERSAGALAKYEEAMAKARAEGNMAREALRAEGVAKESALLSMVRLETTQKIEDGKSAAMGELAQVRAALEAQVPELARDLAKRILGREVA